MSDSLTDVLGGDPPAGVAALDHTVRERLAGQVVTAQHAQARQIAAAIDVAVKGVPLPVRGVIRKALLG